MNPTALFFDAFALRPRPEATRILRPAVRDDDGERLRTFLAAASPADLSAAGIRMEVEGNLWMLTPEAFLYFLPAFLSAALRDYASVSVFASELVGALTEPHREDVTESLGQAAGAPAGLALPEDLAALLVEQQLEWFDSGAPLALFHERVETLTAAEGAAILAFFVALQQAHGPDFPFRELDVAIERYWSRYRAS